MGCACCKPHASLWTQHSHITALQYCYVSPPLCLPLQSYRFSMFLASFLLTLTWLVLVVLLSAAPPDGKEAQVCRRMRDVVFALLFRCAGGRGGAVTLCMASA